MYIYIYILGTVENATNGKGREQDATVSQIKFAYNVCVCVLLRCIYIHVYCCSPVDT